MDMHKGKSGKEQISVLEQLGGQNSPSCEVGGGVGLGGF